MQAAVVAVSAHTTIVPQSRHKRYSTVNAVITPNTEQCRTRTKEKSEPKPALSVTQIRKGLEVEAYTEVSARLTVKAFCDTTTKRCAATEVVVEVDTETLVV